MRIIAINGSSSSGGNTVFLLNRILDTAQTPGAETRLLRSR